MLTSFDFYLSLNKTWALLSAGLRQNELLYISIHDLRCEGRSIPRPKEEP